MIAAATARMQSAVSCSTSPARSSPASVGFGPHSGSQNRDLPPAAQPRLPFGALVGHLAEAHSSIWRIALARTLFSYLPVLLFSPVGHPFLAGGTPPAQPAGSGPR